MAFGNFWGGSDSTAQNTENTQSIFAQTLQSAFMQQYGNNLQALNFLNGKLDAIINNPQGFSPETMAAMNSAAISSTATAYGNAARAANNQIAAHGGEGLPSGVAAQLQAQTANQAAQTESGNLEQIQLANEQQRQTNLQNALQEKLAASNAYNPTGFAGAETGAANSVADLSNAVTNSSSTGLLGGLMKGFAGGFGSGLGSGLGAGLAKGL